MQSKNKESVEIKSEANQINEAARAKLAENIEQVKMQLDSQHHGALENEVMNILKQHKEGQSLKGPNGLAAQAKQNTEYLSKMGNQKNILQFLKLQTAHDTLEERLKSEAIDQVIVMAAKRVHDLLEG